MADGEKAVHFDGAGACDLARRLGVPEVALFATVPSTLDVAHALAAAGAPAGTLVLADAQTAGRGRGGRAWASPAGLGLWLTLIERPVDVAALGVLALRLGLAAARALDAFAPAPVRVKWPNDLHVAGGKLAGILVETRWRGAHPDWVAAGLGLNVHAPRDMPGAAGLAPGVSRLDVLAALVPALRSAAVRAGPLDAAELRDYAERDLARGRRCSAPERGTVAGVAADGALLVATNSGERRCRSGSLILEEHA